MIDTKEWRIGDILTVWQREEVHYERVIQLTPEVLTEDMNPDKTGDVSTQGLSDNLKYEVIPNHAIATILRTYLPPNIALEIADKFYGSDYPMARSTFDNAVKDTGYKGY